MKFNINPIFDILNSEELNATKDAIQDLFSDLIERAEKKGTKLHSDNIKKIWPYLLHLEENEIINCQYEITLLPLSRVGAQEGASGSKVFVTYFKMQLNPTKQSNPLIFKYNNIQNGIADNLKNEINNADSVSDFIKPEYFAIPLHHSVHGNFSFLWSPFTSSIYYRTNGPKEPPTLRENNLWKLMLTAKSDKDTYAVNKIINSTYKYFDLWHNNNDKDVKVNKTYIKEYEWYLRDIDTWYKSWIKIWGGFEKRDIDDFEKKWINPFWVYDQIKNEVVAFKMGAIHGDLHPRNIVISHDDIPKVIDFGWTQAEAHFAKDFALMEANIRFMTLNPDLPYNYLIELSQSIESNSIAEEAAKEPKDPIYLWLHSIRDNLNKCYEQDKFMSEYIIPLFLVSLGLLKFTKIIGNQISARLTVLELANYIYINKLSYEKRFNS